MVEVPKKEVVGKEPLKKEKAGFRKFFRENFFEGNNISSNIFDIFILLLVIVSVTCVILEVIPSASSDISLLSLLNNFEWIFTIIFTVEYLMRTICTEKPLKYIFSFFGIIDLISVLPLYVNMFFKGAQIIQIVRILRLIRIFSRIMTVTNRMNTLSKSMLHLKQHLSADEKFLLFFRPSRKKKLIRYVFIFVFMILSVIDVVFNFMPNSILFNISVFFFFSLVVLLFCMLLLIRTEYLTWSERYMLTNQRIFYSKGIFNEHFISKTYQFVTDISLHQTLMDKILNVGDLVIHNAAGQGEELKITGISRPLEVKRIINDNVLMVQGKSQIRANLNKK